MKHIIIHFHEIIFDTVGIKIFKDPDQETNMAEFNFFPDMRFTRFHEFCLSELFEIFWTAVQNFRDITG